ncbi:MAG TPA: ubiquinol oxidase subunit II [Candidatus Saccharimonadales bacterium]|nr:ubiquinol oxidase subunit II [Candidatus Saccharimonadales bacterium]
MGKKLKILSSLILLAIIVFLSARYFSSHTVDVLQPKGVVAQKEKTLIIIGLLLAVIVVVPVYFLTVAIAWKYREGNKKAHRNLDWDHNNKLELLWWGIPIAIIAVLSVITWQSAHSLDPFKPIQANAYLKPMTIQVVSLDWKWLFIYPDQRIASVNFVEFPVNQPVDFQVTSDTVMNSFWIPSLGSQIYSMPGMSTQLNMMATSVGSYYGSSANISGSGFSGMNFTAMASSLSDFYGWVSRAQQSPEQLTQSAYQRLSQPSKNVAPKLFSLQDNNLYQYVVNKYMPPKGGMPMDGHGV